METNPLVPALDIKSFDIDPSRGFLSSHLPMTKTSYFLSLEPWQDVAYKLPTAEEKQTIREKLQKEREAAEAAEAARRNAGGGNPPGGRGRNY